MEDHFTLNDWEFERQFQYCALDPSLFSHEAHLRLAWIHIKKYGEPQGIENICEQLILFTQFHGAFNKFNKTLTVGAVKAVHHFMQKSDSKIFGDFISEFPRLKYNFKDLMDAHYGFDIFNSKEAKKAFLEPDLLPFD